MVFESRVTWATSVPILVFLDLKVLDLGPIRDRQTDRLQTASSLNAPPRGWGITSNNKLPKMMQIRNTAENVSEQAVGGRPPRYASVPCKLTISSYLFARWHLFRHVGY